MKEVIKQGRNLLVGRGVFYYSPEAIEFAKIRLLEHPNKWISSYPRLAAFIPDEIAILNEMLIIEEKKLFSIDKKKKMVCLKRHKVNISFSRANFAALENMVTSNYTWVSHLKSIDIGWYEDTIYRQIDNVLKRINSSHIPLWKKAISHPGKVNIHSRAKTEVGKLLSNFSDSPMKIKGIKEEVRSFDSIWQALKFDDPAERKKLYSMKGLDARQYATSAPAPRRTGDVSIFRGKQYIIGLDTYDLASSLCEKYFSKKNSKFSMILS